MYMRLAATQSWPLFPKADQKRFDAIAFASTSASTMEASFPPNSRVIRLRSFAAASMTRRPVAVDPVNEILLTPGWLVSHGPSSSPPETTFKTPAGRRSRASSPILRHVRGVKGEGLRTTVLPVQSAAETFHMESRTG